MWKQILVFSAILLVQHVNGNEDMGRYEVQINYELLVYALASVASFLVFQ